jgi:iron(III) transport system substrate-binding protein
MITLLIDSDNERHYRLNTMKTIHWIAASVALFAGAATAQDNVLNLYSARHYQTDEALYSNFTKLTGIKINRIEGGEDPLIERIRNEGARRRPT